MNNKKTVRMVESFVMLMVAVFMARLVISGNVSRYMNPKNAPWLVYCAVLLAVMAFSNVLYASLYEKASENGSKKKNMFSHMYLFVLPVILCLCVGTFKLDTTLLANKGISLSSKTTVQTLKVTKGKSNLTEDELAGDVTYNEDGDIMMTSSSTFNSGFLSLRESDTSLIGKRIQIVGFVYKSKDFGDDQFVIARNAMVCCNLDMQVTGYLADCEDASVLEAGNWVHAKGTLDLTEWNESPVFKVHVDEYEVVPEPADPQQAYIYPY